MSAREWTPAQASIFGFDRTTAVSAGAGSGKTAAMVELYLRLVAGKVEGRPAVLPSRIVAITFTDKAAWEMRERIRREAAAKSPDGSRGELARELESGIIGTIHGFAAQLLREFPVEAAVDPTFGVLAEDESREMLGSAATGALFDALGRRDVDVEALVHTLPLSGGEFAKGLLDQLVMIHARVRGLGLPLTGLNANHARLCAEARAGLVRQLDDALRAAADLAMANGRGKTKDLGQALSAALGSWRVDLLPNDPALLGARLEELEALLGGTWSGDGVSAAKGEAKDAIKAARSLMYVDAGGALVDGFARLVEDLELRYANAKRRAARLDFEDLQLALRDLLDLHPFVADELRSRFAVVMVDEFQDTNRLQWDLVRRLCQPAGSAPEAPIVGGKLFVVGDPKQSIYGFRGAEVGVFRSVMEHAAQDGRLVHLSDNFRSTAPLLSYVNVLFEDLMQGGEVRFGEGDRLVPHREAEGAAVEVLDLPVPDSADRGRRLEARALAQRMREAHEAGMRYGEIALLMRRFTRIELYLEEMRRAGVPFHVVKGRGFFRAVEVVDLYHLLRLLVRPGSPLALVALLRSPLVALSDETILLLFLGPDGKRRSRPETVLEEGLSPALRQELARAVASGQSLLTAADLERELARADRFTACYKSLRAGADSLGAAAIVRRAIRELALDATLLTQFQGEQRLANVRKLMEVLTALEEQGAGTLPEVVARLGTLLDEDPKESEAQLVLDGLDAVHVMTIHQSKGLEFPMVMLGELASRKMGGSSPVEYDPDLGLGIKPREPLTRKHADTPVTLAIEERAEARQEAESQRLFYVALTRARDYLVLANCPPKIKYSGTWRAWIEDRQLLLAEHVKRRMVEAKDLVAPHREPRQTPYAAALAAVGALDSLTEGAAPVPAPITPDAAAAVQRAFTPPAVHAGRLTLTVTDLNELALCPRRYAFAVRLGLEEPEYAGPAAPPVKKRGRARTSPQDLADRTTRRAAGTLIHALIEHVDPQAPAPERRAQLKRAAADFGGALDDERLVAQVVDDAARLLEGPFGDRLRALPPANVLREQAFIQGFALDPALRSFVPHSAPGGAEGPRSLSVLLRGQVDLVLLEPAGPLVIDYKYQAGEPGEELEYRMQLACYAFALEQAGFGTARAAIQFLRGDQPLVELTPEALGTDRVAGDIAELAGPLASPAGPPPLAALPIKPAEECARLHCGFYGRCHARIVPPLPA